MHAIGQNRITQYALLIGGVFVSIIGVAHIFMPALGYDKQVPLSMSTEISDHFYYLGTYAICLFLLTIGSISIYVSKKGYPDVSLTICCIFALLWIGRLILEIIYPVKLKLFFLDNPTIVLTPFIASIALIYLSGAVSALASRFRT
jgi:hypothetical protein